MTPVALRVGMALLAVGLMAAGAPAAVTPAQKCQQGKNKQAGKYAYCRQKAEAKFATTGDGGARTEALQKCLDKYAAKWPALEQKAADAGDPCPSTGDQGTIQTCLDGVTTGVADALAGGALACGAAEPQGQLLKTGQTQCWDTGGTVIPCAGTGQDGELQQGLARAYVDNGNGTITDTRTGLMWEKLSDDGSIHDKDNTYTWANAFAAKVATLNAGGGFAGYTDWRVPNVSELLSLVNFGAVNPSVSLAFNSGCTASCTVLTCSCTGSNYYWSSSTYQPSLNHAWNLHFGGGYTYGGGLKSSGNYVRAVRGGS
jgi:hypothetical protein